MYNNCHTEWGNRMERHRDPAENTFGTLAQTRVFNLSSKQWWPLVVNSNARSFGRPIRPSEPLYLSSNAARGNVSRCLTLESVDNERTSWRSNFSSFHGNRGHIDARDRVVMSGRKQSFSCSRLKRECIESWIGRFNDFDHDSVSSKKLLFTEIIHIQTQFCFHSSVSSHRK